MCERMAPRMNGSNSSPRGTLRSLRDCPSPGQSVLRSTSHICIALWMLNGFIHGILFTCMSTQLDTARCLVKTILQLKLKSEAMTKMPTGTALLARCGRRVEARALKSQMSRSPSLDHTWPETPRGLHSHCESRQVWVAREAGGWMFYLCGGCLMRRKRQSLPVNLVRTSHGT